MTLETVGNRVRHARRMRGMGVNQLDRLVGVSQGYTSRLERSLREPRAKTLRRIAHALGVSIGWLASGEGEMIAVESGVEPVPPVTGYPNLDRALELGLMTWEPATLEYGVQLRKTWPADRGLGEWVELLESYDQVVTGSKESEAS